MVFLHVVQCPNCPTLCHFCNSDLHVQILSCRRLYVCVCKCECRLLRIHLPSWPWFFFKTEPWPQSLVCFSRNLMVSKVLAGYREGLGKDFWMPLNTFHSFILPIQCRIILSHSFICISSSYRLWQSREKTIVKGDLCTYVHHHCRLLPRLRCGLMAQQESHLWGAWNEFFSRSPQSNGPNGSRQFVCGLHAFYLLSSLDTMQKEVKSHLSFVLLSFEFLSHHHNDAHCIGWSLWIRVQES